MILRSKGAFAVTTVVLATLFNLSSTNPVIDTLTYNDLPKTCSTYQCSRDAELIEDYQVGKAYQYDYEVETITEMRSHQDQQSNVKMTARVLIDVLTPCEFTMKMENVDLVGSDVSSREAMNVALTRNAIQFVMEDRRIQHVCSHTDDPTWVINLKKGVISSFQQQSKELSGVNITETDVVGTCRTQYIPNADLSQPGYAEYKKVKHMETCQGNQKLYQFALNLPDMNIQNLPMIKSEHSCDVVVYGQGRLESSRCFESHLFKPFSSASSGALTTVTQNIKFVGESTGSKTARVEQARKSSLLYTHEAEHVDDQDHDEAAQHVLNLLNEYQTTEKAEKRPEIFADLVHSMRHLSHPKLMKIFYSGITNDRARSLVLDALPLLKTDAGIRLMQDIIESGDLPLDILDMWFDTLPFYKTPTRGMLAIISNFVSGGEPRNSALLGVSAMVSTFCSNHANCHDLPEVQDIVLRYESLLGSNCLATGQMEEDRVILTLKALRNIGYVKRAHATLESCWTDYTNSMFIRLAALDTVRQVRCGQNEFDFKQKLFATFSDTTADSELRIGAYMALMSCPSQSLVNLLKNILVNEPVNQVGSFVWTHLTNIQESQSLSEYKKALKTFIGSEFLQNKWKTDVRKFSRFFESSYYSDELNVGATADGQIVFSQDSYLPRSAMVNLTANVFGENLNLFEMGTRMEGFESLFEDLFGPDGYFREDSLHKLLQSLRPRRSTLSDFQQTYNRDDYDANPKGNMFMRMFGKDLAYSSFDGLPSLLNKFTHAWPFALTKDMDYQRSSIFLDGKIVVPTLAGLPLDLAVNGTSAISLISKNKLDMANVFQTGDANLEVKLYPTATLQVSAVMSVNAMYAQTGLKSVSKLHTSTFVDGQLLMEGGKLMKAHLNVPKRTVELLDVSVDFLTLNNGNYEPLASKNEVQKYEGCTPGPLNNIFGMKMCGSALYYNNPTDSLDLVFAGPFSVKLGLEKTDTFNQYTLEYLWSNVRDQDGTSKTRITAMVDTPGSTVNRRSSINILFDEIGFSYLALAAEIPVHKIGVNAVYQWTETKKLIKASLSMEQKTLLSINQVLKKLSAGRYDAQLQVSYKSVDVVDWTGALVALDTKINFQSMLKSSALPRPIAAEGAMTQTNDRWDISGFVKSHWAEADINGLFEQTDTSFKFKSDLTYSLGAHRQHLEVQSFYKINSLGDLDKHVFFLLLNPSKYPQWSTALNWEIQASDGHLENKAKIRLGPNTYLMEQIFSSQASMTYQSLRLKLGFENKQTNNVYKVDLEHRLGSHENVNRLQMVWPKWIDFETYLTQKKEATSQALEAGLKYSELDLAAGIQLDQNPSPNVIKGLSFLRWGHKDDVNANARATFKLKQRNPVGVDYSLESSLSLPHMSPLEATGSIKLEEAVTVLEMSCVHDKINLQTLVQWEKIGTGMKLLGQVSHNDKTYSLNALTRNDKVKSLHAELKLDKTYNLNINAREDLHNLMFDLSWDGSEDNRVLLKAKRLPSALKAEFQVTGNAGGVTVEWTGDGALHADANYNGAHGVLDGEYSFVPGNYVLKATFESTVPSLRRASFDFRHVMKNDRLLSQVLAMWNDEEHVFKLSGQKAAESWIQLETSSTYDALNGLHLRLDSGKIDKRQTAKLNLAYKTDRIVIESIYDNGKPKEAKLTVSTPWEYIKDVKAGFVFNFGKEVKLDTYLTWNDISVATANVTGHLLPHDVTLDFAVSQLLIGQATGGFVYKKSSHETKVSTQLKYGQNNFNLDAEYRPMPCVVHFKTDISTHAIMVNSEFSLSKGLRAPESLDINTHLDVDKKRLIEVNWKSLIQSITQHSFDVKGQFLDNDIIVIGSNGRVEGGLVASYEATLIKGRKLRSSAKFSIQGDSYDDITIQASIVMGHKKTSIFMQNKANLGTGDLTSKIQLTSNGEVAQLIHQSKFNSNVKDWKLSTSIDVKTPFKYLPKASFESTISLKEVSAQKWEMKTDISGSFKEETITLKETLTLTMSTNHLVEYAEYNFEAKRESNRFPATHLQSQGIYQPGSVLSSFASVSINDQEYAVKLNLKRDADTRYVTIELDTPASVHHFVCDGKLYMSSTANQFHLSPSLNLMHQDASVFKVSFDVRAEDDHHYMSQGDLYAPYLLGESDLFFNSTLHWTKANIRGEALLDVNNEMYTSFVELENSPTQKQVELRINTPNQYLLRGLLRNDDTVAEFKTQVKSPWRELKIDLAYDKSTRSLTASFNDDDKKIELKGQLDVQKGLKIKGQIENNFIESLTSLKFDGALVVDRKWMGGAVERVQLDMKASANANHFIDINANLLRSKGDMIVSVNLPSVKVTHSKLQYTINEGQGQVVLELNGDRLTLDWKKPGETLEISLETPYESIKNLRIKKTQTSEKMLVQVNHNGQDIATFNAHVNQNTVSLKLMTAYESMKHVEFQYALKMATDFHLAVVYNQCLEARLLGKVSEDWQVSNYSAKIIMESMSINYEVSVGHDLRSNDKGFDILLKGIIPTSIHGHWSSNEAILTVDSWLCSYAGYAGTKDLKLTWNEGIMDITGKDGNLEFLKSELAYEKPEPYKGSVKVTVSTFFDLIKDPVSLHTTYDIGSVTKKTELLVKSGHDSHVSISTQYKMTEDTFNGELIWKSSLENYSEVTLKASYNIAVEPTAFVSIERDGKRDFIKTKLTFGNVIPTVEITTSFPQFEKLVFQGNYQHRQQHIKCDINLSRNDEKLFVLDISTKMAEWHNAEIVVNVLTPITNWKTLVMELGWKLQDDPYALKLKLVKGTDIFLLKGQLDIRRKQEFSMRLETPFENYESIHLSGKLGTTSVGKQMGLSFAHNTVRRDLSFAYDFDEENRALVQIKTPLEQYRSIKMRSTRMAEMGSRMDFGFEAQGKDNDFAIGFKYDFSNGWTKGLLLAKFKETKKAGLEANLEYNLDTHLRTFDGQVYFKELTKENKEIVHILLKLNRTPGHTIAHIQSDRFQDIKLELQSDYKTKVTASLDIGQKNTNTISLIKVGGFNFDILLKTTMRGYEKIKVELRTDPIDPVGHQYRIAVFRNNEKIGTVTVNTVIKRGRDFGDFGGKLDIKVEVAGLTYTVGISYKEGYLEMFLKAPKKDWTLSALHNPGDGTTSITVLDLKLDDETLHYSSERVWEEGYIIGQSKFMTTFKAFETKEQETHYEIKYSKDFEKPFELTYKVIANNEETINMKWFLDVRPFWGRFSWVDFLEKFEVKGFLSYPLILPNDIDVQLKGELANAASPYLEARYNDTNIKVVLSHTQNSMTFKSVSNIAGFEDLELNTNWDNDESKTKAAFQAKMNGRLMLDGKLAFDKSPFTRFKLVIQSDALKIGKQEFELKLPRSNNRHQYQIEMEAKGTIQFKLKFNLVMGSDTSTLDISLQAPKLRLDNTLKAILKHDGTTYGLQSMIKHRNKQYKNIMELELTSALIGKLVAKIDWDQILKFSTGLNFDLESSEKVFTLKTHWNNNDLTINGNIAWGPTVGNVVMSGSFNGKTIELVFKRKSYENILCVLDIFGDKITFKSINEVQSKENIKIHATLKIAEKLMQEYIPYRWYVNADTWNGKAELSITSHAIPKSLKSSGSFAYGSSGGEQHSYKADLNYARSDPMHGHEFNYVIAKVEPVKQNLLDIAYKYENFGKLLTIKTSLDGITPVEIFQNFLHDYGTIIPYRYDVPIQLRIKSPIWWSKARNSFLSLLIQSEDLDGSPDVKVIKLEINKGDSKKPIQEFLHLIAKVQRQTRDKRAVHETQTRYDEYDIDLQASSHNDEDLLDLKLHMSHWFNWNANVNIKNRFKTVLDVKLAKVPSKLAKDNPKTGEKIANWLVFTVHSDDQNVLDLKLDIVNPLNWDVNIYFKDRFKSFLNVKVAPALKEGELNFYFNSVEGKKLETKLRLVNEVSEKFAKLDIITTKHELTLEAISAPGVIKFEIESSLAANKILDIEFEASYNANKLGLEFEFNDYELILEFARDDVSASFKAEAFEDYSASGTYNINDKTVMFKSSMNGKETSIDISYSPNSVTIKVIEPFSGSGQINFNGEWSKTPTGMFLKANGDFQAINYQLKATLGPESMTIFIRRGTQEWSLDAGLTPISNGKSVTVQVVSTEMEPFELTGLYTLTAVAFKTQMKATLPTRGITQAEVEVDFDFPHKLGLRSKALMDQVELFAVDMSASGDNTLKDVRSKFTLKVPKFGIPKEIGLEIVYKVIGKRDFELKVALMTPSQTFQGGIKFHLHTSNRLRQLLDAQILIDCFNLTLGGVVERVEQSWYASPRLSKLTGYLNNFNMETIIKPSEYSFKLTGDNLYEDLIFKHLPFLDNKLSVNFEYKSRSHLVIDVKPTTSSQFRASFAFSQNSINGGFTIKSEKYRYFKTLDLIIEAPMEGRQGRMEVTMGGLQQHQMKVWFEDDSRKTRAIFKSPDYGEYQFLMDQDIKSGILVLTTRHGLHKVSYKVNTEDEKFELTTKLETPLLSKGQADLKISLDTKSNVYSAAINFNSDHFLSWSVDFSRAHLDAAISLESTYLRTPLSATVSLQNKPIALGAKISLRWLNQEHMLELNINPSEFKIVCSLESPLIWDKKWHLEGKLSQGYNIQAMALMGDKKIELKGNLTVRNMNDFSGSLVFQGTSISFSKANLDFDVKISTQKTIIELDMTTTHPDVTRMKVMLSLMEASTDRYDGKFVVICPGMENIEGAFTLPKNKWVENNAEMTISALSGKVHMDTQWNFKEKDNQWMELTIKAPRAKKIQVMLTKAETEMKINANAINIDFIEALEAEFHWSPEISLEEGWFSTSLTADDTKLTTEVKYILKQKAKFLNAEVKTPFVGHENYAVNLGYEDGERKTAKAHLTSPMGDVGFKFDYFFHSLRDFLIEVDIDLPIRDLKFTGLKLGHTLNREGHNFVVGAEWMTKTLNFEYKMKTDASSILFQINGAYCTYVCDLNVFLNRNERKGDLDLQISTPNWKIVSPLTVDLKQQDFDLKIEVNDVRHFVFDKNSKMDTITIELKDILFDVAFKISVANGNSFSIETVWNTTQPEQTREFLSFNWSDNDFYGQITWSTQDSHVIFAKWDKTPGKCLYSGSLLHNDNRIFGLDATFLTQYEQQELDQTERLVLVTPSHQMELIFDTRHHADAVHKRGSLKWNKPNEEAHGLEYIYDAQSMNGNDLTYNIALKRVGKEYQTFSVRYQTSGTDKKAFYFDIDHPSNEARRVHLEVTMDASDSNNDRTKVDFVLTYKFGNRKARENELTVTIDMANKELEVEIGTEENTYKLKAKIVGYELQIELSKNGQPLLTGLLQVDTDRPQLTARLSTSDKSVDLYAGLLQPNQIRLTVQTQGSQEVQSEEDINIGIELSPDGRVLKLEFQWRPDLVYETKDALVSIQSAIVESLAGRHEVGESLAVVQHILVLTVNETADNLKDTLTIDLRAWTNIAKDVMSNLRTLYANQLSDKAQMALDYMGDALSTVMREIGTYSQGLNLVRKAFVDMYQDVINNYISFVFEQLKSVFGLVAQLRQSLINEIAAIEVGDFNAGDCVKVTVLLLRDNLDKLSRHYAQFKERLALIPATLGAEVNSDLNDFLEGLARHLKKFKTVNEALNFYWEYQSWFEEFHLSRHIEEATQDLRSYMVDISRQLSVAKATVMKIWNKTMGLINKTLNDYPLLAYGVSVGKKMLRVAKALSEQLSIESNLRTWIRRVMGRVDALASTIVRIIDVVYHNKDFMSYELKYDDAGDLVYLQVLPFQWYSFMDTPDIVKVVDLLQSAEPSDPIDLKALQHDLLEVIGTVSQVLRSKNVIPPFSATALVAGDSHIVTFDQTFYDFSGSDGCSYLLTSDFSQGKFSAIAHYDNNMKRTSIDVISDGHTIGIDTSLNDPDLIKVTLDRRNTQLPIRFDHTYVYREENTIVVENIEGLRTTCNTLFNVCTFTISGWYFGKTGGLLGIYDNEPSNDWMTSERMVVSTLEDFVNSWSMDKEKVCPVKVKASAALRPRQPSLQELEACDGMFGNAQTSALMPCFSTIDPTPYMSMCLSDMDDLKNKPDKRTGVCPAAAAYIEQCRQAGVELWMPAQCVRCSLNQEAIRHGESTIIQGNVLHTSDVVFIVQQSKCLENVHLEDLPYLIDRTLVSKGLKDNKFALVGFGGTKELVKPHIFTSGSQMFNDVNKMPSAMSNLKTDGENAGDTFEALQYAARLNFRPAVIKTFVMVSCDSKKALSSRSYGDSMTMLTEQGIKLHLLTPLELRFKGSPARMRLTSKIYGFTKEGVVTASGLDQAFRRQLKDPKNLLSTLAQESGGSVFDLDRLESRKRTSVKKASTMMAKSIAQLSRPLDCQVCDCLANADGKGRLMCHRCILPQIDIVLKNWDNLLE